MGTWGDIAITTFEGERLETIRSFRPDDGITRHGQYFRNNDGQIDQFKTNEGDSFYFWYDAQGNVDQAIKIPAGADNSQQTYYMKNEDNSWTVDRPDGSKENFNLGAGGITVDRNGPHLPSVPNSINERTGIPITPMERNPLIPLELRPPAARNTRIR